MVYDHRRFVAATFILLGITSIMFSLAIFYFVNITASTVEALVPTGEDLSSLNIVFGAGYAFSVLEFLLGIASLSSAYMLLKKKGK